MSQSKKQTGSTPKLMPPPPFPFGGGADAGGRVCVIPQNVVSRLTAHCH